MTAVTAPLHRPARWAPSSARPALAAILLAVACLIACGCATSRPGPISAHELAEAQTFPYYRLYWVGPRFGSYPLSAADARRSYNSAIGDSVYYGGCLPGKTPPVGGGGCQLALQVTTVIYKLHSNADLGPQRNVLLRGVPAVIYDGGRSIELYSGRMAIDVFSDSLADALSAVRELRPMNAPGAAAGPLPPPVYCPFLSGPQTARLQIAMHRLPHRACHHAAVTLRADRALFGKP
jgi:hypothetical protein